MTRRSFLKSLPLLLGVPWALARMAWAGTAAEYASTSSNAAMGPLTRERVEEAIEELPIHIPIWGNDDDAARWISG